LDRRAALLSVATRVAAVAVVVAVVALLFVIMKPASRQSVAGATPSDITGSTNTVPLQSSQGDIESKPALAEFKALLASPPSQPATREQSQQLLQNFLQWSKKANTTETSQ
jgi:negative regulator of sigma E activity